MSSSKHIIAAQVLACLGLLASTALPIQAQNTTPTTVANSSSSTEKAAPGAIPAISAAPGSPEEIAQLRALMEAINTRLQSLEAAQKKTEESAVKSAPTVTSASKTPVVISGLVQVRGDAFRSQAGPGARSFDTLRLRRAEVRVTAPSITSRISGTIMFDFAKRLSQNAAMAVNQSSTFFQEAQISYLLRKNSTGGSAPNNIYLDAGQFKIPVGYEGDLIGSPATPFAERALMFAARDPFGGGFGDVRETGAQLRGTQGQFRYWFGVFNGLGERQNNDSASDTKAFLARLMFSPRRVQGLSLGVSGGQGNNRNTNTAGQHADRSLMNLFANYQRKKLNVRGEFLTGDSQRLPLNDEDFTNDVRGYYAHVGYLFTPKIEGVLRYDTFNFDRNLNDAAVRDILAGVNYYIKGNNAKIQLNVIRRRGGSNIAAANGFSSSLVSQFANDRTEFRLQGQVGF